MDPHLAMKRRNRLVGLAAFGLALAMLGAAYAAVPLYDLFCRVTGFGGRTMVATAVPGHIANHPINIRLDVTIGNGLRWQVEPEMRSLTVLPGEPHTVMYKVNNLTDETVTAMAAYNVAPTTVGQFFNKLQCFCFSEQTLKPREEIEFALVFFIDPAIVTDAEDSATREITLSYTFYKQKGGPKPVAALAQSRTN